MKLSNPSDKYSGSITTRVRSRGVTLVELMVSMGILAVVAGGVMASMLYSQRLAQSNLAQSYAAITAQSIIEQLVRLPADTLTDETTTGAEILIPYVTSSNNTSLERISVPWSTDDDVFTDIGPAENPTQGILVDAAYIPAGNKIRPERYMRFRVNLERTVEAAEHRVSIVLRYQWEVPDRRADDGAPVYLSGILTTVRSTAVSF